METSINAVLLIKLQSTFFYSRSTWCKERYDWCNVVVIIIIIIITLLTPCSRVLPKKLTVPQQVKKFSAFYGTRMFITAFKTARHLSLS